MEYKPTTESQTTEQMSDGTESTDVFPESKSTSDMPTIQIRTVVRRIAKTMAQDDQAEPTEEKKNEPIPESVGEKEPVVDKEEMQDAKEEPQPAVASGMTKRRVTGSHLRLDPVQVREATQSPSDARRSRTYTTGSFAALSPEEYQQVLHRKRNRPIFFWRVAGIACGLLMLIGGGVYAIQSAHEENPALVTQVKKQDKKQHLVPVDDSLSKGKWIGLMKEKDPSFTFPYEEQTTVDEAGDKQDVALAKPNDDLQADEPDHQQGSGADQGNQVRPKPTPHRPTTDPTQKPPREPDGDKKPGSIFPPILKPSDKDNDEAERENPNQGKEDRSDQGRHDRDNLFDRVGDALDDLIDHVFKMSAMFDRSETETDVL
ncbi:hypothetical protein [Laceyella putida]|uniref:Uncharacterized protein n=1 Tax=Laceyella putida TaxID=110101 RepID=A0ABW2RL19_9BACL